MRLKGLLSQKKSKITKKWFELISKTYPKETSRFFQRVKDQFANPVGHTFSSSLEKTVDLLLEDAGPDAFRPVLDDVVKIRAIQDFTPSGAVGFIFLLKTAVRQSLDKKEKTAELLSELLEFESEIDGLTLICFDLHQKNREKMYSIKANELRNRTKKFIEHLQRVTDIEGQPPYSLEEMESQIFKDQQGGGK